MAKLLHVLASPRAESYSTRVAGAFLESYRRSHPGDVIETLDVFAADLPAFEAPAAGAKYAVLSGTPPAGQAEKAWQRVIEVINRFKTLDKLVLSCPMWNFGIPYRLKQFFDVIVQPGLTFSHSQQAGYQGLVTGRPAMLILARGGTYPPGQPGSAYDMQRGYLRLILGFIGFTDIREIVIEPTLAEGPAGAENATEQALARARQEAGAF